MGRRQWTLGLSLCGVMAALSVYLVNGTGLFYYDTVGYLDAGDSVFRSLGFGGAPSDDAVVVRPESGPADSAADGTAPDVPVRNSAAPKPVTPDLVNPDLVNPDLVNPDLVTPDPAAATTAVPGKVIPDTAMADAPIPETAIPNLGPPKTPTPPIVTETVPDQPATPPAKVTIANRSALYGVVLSLAARIGWLDLVVLLNLAALWLAVWLAARASLRGYVGQDHVARLTAWLILAGCTGSLPFYVAFLMPDILAPILILVLATLSIHARTMPRGDIGAALLLALVAVLAHPSHLLLAAILLPAGALLSPASRGYRVRLFALMLAVILGLGIAERIAFSRIVSATEGSQVIIMPFLTARLIDDGPGLDYLADHCPDVAQPACALHAELLRPGGDAARFDAPVILFSRDPVYGSYRLLPALDQLRIANDQIRFASKVTFDRPISVAVGVIRNVIDQVRKSAITMTIPTPEIVSLLVVDGGRMGPQYREGRLIAPDSSGSDPSWLEPVTRVHALVYLVSTLGILVLLFRRGQPANQRSFAAMVLIGLLGNALVCGAISEPADRYGARTMFLLPMLFALLTMGRCFTVGPRFLQVESGAISAIGNQHFKTGSLNWRELGFKFQVQRLI